MPLTRETLLFLQQNATIPSQNDTMLLFWFLKTSVLVLIYFFMTFLIEFLSSEVIMQYSTAFHYTMQYNIIQFINAVQRYGV